MRAVLTRYFILNIKKFNIKTLKIFVKLKIREF